MDEGFPAFRDRSALDATRSWTAAFESWDQRKDDVYYVITLYEGEAAVARFMAQVSPPWVGERWDAPAYLERLRAELHAVAARGQGNTDYRGELDRPRDGEALPAIYLPRSGRISCLTLRVSGRKQISLSRRARWREIVGHKRYESCAHTMILLGELLQLLDGGAHCRLRPSDGGWYLETERLAVYGRIGQAMERSSHFEATEPTERTSFQGETWLVWDGAYAGEGQSARVKLSVADNATAARVLRLANELFHQVHVSKAGTQP